MKRQTISTERERLNRAPGKHDTSVTGARAGAYHEHMPLRRQDRLEVTFRAVQNARIEGSPIQNLSRFVVEAGEAGLKNA